jgi:HD-GYP domain-containing protein (c-di-GMP phosphodiesterase class II)
MADRTKPSRTVPGHRRSFLEVAGVGLKFGVDMPLRSDGVLRARRHSNVSRIRCIDFNMLRPIEIQPEFLGHPLPWDLFDRYGVLLLARGATISDPTQVARLYARKLFARAEDLGDLEVSEMLSPFTALAEVAATLARVFEAGAGQGVAPRLLRMADTIRAVIATDQDASLGWIALDRGAPYCIRHSIAVALICELIGNELGIPAAEQRSVLCAALTMNVGMQALQDRLTSRNGQLSQEERAQIAAHPERGRLWLQARGVIDEVWLAAVGDHHELLDGRGYPRGLTASMIAVPARLIALADIYCAKTGERFYRPPKLPSTAARDILRGRSSGVDPMLAGILFRLIGAHPPGTLVRLANREVAVITHNAIGGPPVVVGVLNPMDEPLPQPTVRDASKLATSIRSYVTFDPALHRFDLDRLWGYAH